MANKTSDNANQQNTNPKGQTGKTGTQIMKPSELVDTGSSLLALYFDLQVVADRIGAALVGIDEHRNTALDDIKYARGRAIEAVDDERDGAVKKIKDDKDAALGDIKKALDNALAQIGANDMPHNIDNARIENKANNVV